MDSIKTVKLDAPKSQIMSSAELRSDFDGCATLFKDFVAQSNMADHRNERQISALTGNKVRGGYVPEDEWQAMSKEERAAEIKARDDRKNASGGGGGGKPKQGGAKKPGAQKGGGKLSKFKQAAAKWTKAEFKVAKAAVKGMKEEDSDDEETVPMKEGDGDAHSMRQRLGKKKSA